MTNYHAGTHNSDPNYEAIAFGNTYGRSSKARNATASPTGVHRDEQRLSDKPRTRSARAGSSTCRRRQQLSGPPAGQYESDDVPFDYAAKMKNDNAYCQAALAAAAAAAEHRHGVGGRTTPRIRLGRADCAYDMENCASPRVTRWLSQTCRRSSTPRRGTAQKSTADPHVRRGRQQRSGGFGPGQTNQVVTIAIGSQGTVKAGYQDANRYATTAPRASSKAHSGPHLDDDTTTTSGPRRTTRSSPTPRPATTLGVRQSDLRHREPGSPVTTTVSNCGRVRSSQSVTLSPVASRPA